MSIVSPFEIKPLEATFGAVVTGLELSRLDDASFADLYASWLEYALLVFPGQHLSKQEQVVFAKRFGELEFDGLDQANIGPLPRALIGRGTVEVRLIVDGKPANVVIVVRTIGRKRATPASRTATSSESPRSRR